MNSYWIVIPNGKLALGSEEEAAAQRRKELREKLLRGDEIVVTQEGQVTDPKARQNPNQPAIVVPEGKLATSFYWYDRDPELYKAEVEAMRRFFPQFKLEKLSYGKLSWVGVLQPNNIRPRARWYLQAVYAHNHPDNSTYGGSVRVYSIDPDLKKIAAEVGPIPHLLRDESGELYLCTASPSDIKAYTYYSTTAASALAWAAKWIAAFELWMAGDLTTSEFAGHNI